MSYRHLFTVLLLFGCSTLFGQTVTIQTGGTWNILITSVATPGNNPINNIESPVNQASLKVKYSGDWIVYVNKADVSWHNNFRLYVQRTGDGNGGGSISDGGTYQLIIDSATLFFQGNKNRNAIDVQYLLTSSGSVPASYYVTSVEYTIVGL
ncbi:hypothetical protein ACFL4L_00845 [bacterium]